MRNGFDLRIQRLVYPFGWRESIGHVVSMLFAQHQQIAPELFGVRIVPEIILQVSPREWKEHVINELDRCSRPFDVQ